MNLFLIEPYNPYVKFPKKKTAWELAEEEALYYKIIEEALKQQQTQKDSVKHPLSQQITQTVAINEGVGGNTGDFATYRMTEDNSFRVTEDGSYRITE